MSKKDLTFYNKTERPWLNRLDRSSLVGHTTDNSTRIWFRFKKEGEYLFVLARKSLRGQLVGAPDLSENPPVVRTEDGGKIELVGFAEFSVGGGTDFTYTVDTTSQSHGILPLLPETRYYYAVYSKTEERWEIGKENQHGFQTLPEDTDRDWDVCFGLYSCHMPYDKNHGSKADASMWSVMHDELSYANARFVIGGGDQVYSDGTDYLNIWAYLKKVKKEDPQVSDMRSWYRDIYRGYWGFPDVKAVHRSFPNYMIWDDHEIKDGWGSFTRAELSNELDSLFEWENQEENLKLADRMFEAAELTFFEYQHAHNPATPEGQYDFSVSHCGADHFFLDMRGFRDFERGDYAILGKAQYDRLKAWAGSLDSGRPGPIFVVSPVPMVHLKDFVSNLLDWLSIFGARDDVRDHWAHEKHHKEFRQVLDTLFRASSRTGRPLVVLSGDVHLGSVFEIIDDKKKYPGARVYQVTSSAITYAPLGQIKFSLLSKGVARYGRIGVHSKAGNTEGYSGYSFRNHLIFPQFNFALIRYQTRDGVTTSLSADLVGQSDDGRVKESKRLELLNLGSLS